MPSRYEHQFTAVRQARERAVRLALDGSDYSKGARLEALESGLSAALDALFDLVWQVKRLEDNLEEIGKKVGKKNARS